MKAVNKAYRVLKDDRQREIYDRRRKRRSASSDVDQDVSEEDYECYNSSDDDLGFGEEMFAQLFFKIFMRNFKNSPSPGPSGLGKKAQMKSKGGNGANGGAKGRQN